MMLVTPALLALVASASGESLAIVDTESVDALVGLAGQVTRALVEEARAQKYAVLGPEELRKKLDDKKYTELRKCAGKVGCAAQYLQGLGAKKAVLGLLAKDDRNYLLKLWLVDLDTLAVIADVDRPILIAARRFQKDVQQAVPPLLRGEREARGTLVVDSTVKNTQVTVNGEFIGVAPVTLTLRPGKYEVKLEKPKYLPISRLMAVEANQETKETFKLLLIPGAIPDEEVIPPLGKPGEGQATGKPLAVSPRTWILGGVTVAALGTGAYFGLTARSADQKLQDGYDPATGIYQGTRAQALSARQNALVANVALGVGVLGLAASIASLVMDANAPDGAVQVTPAVTPGGGGFVVGGHF